MQQSENNPSYVSSVARALSASPQPLSVDALVQQVCGDRPANKSTRSAVYRALKQLYQAVPLGAGRYGWLSHLLQGNTFRHNLGPDEVRRGFLLLDELEHAVFYPQFFQNHRPEPRSLTIEFLGGARITADAAIERKMWSLKLGKPLAEWIDEQGGQTRDDLFITVVDAVAGVYSLRLQPREMRDEAALQERNMQVAQVAEELVESSRRADKLLPTWELAAMLIGRGVYDNSLPPDDLHLVLHQYSTLALENGLGYTVPEHAEPTSKSGGARTQSRAAFAPVQSPKAQAWGGEDAEPWEDGQGDADPAGGDGDGEDSCADYEDYMEHFGAFGSGGAPLSHGDYHLLEAELEMLIGLEQDFGYLLPEQYRRVDELAERLFIDPESFRGDPDDAPDSDYDEPPFWQN